MILFLVGILLFTISSPACAGDQFADETIMAVVTDAPSQGAAVDLNIPQAGYHYQASIPVDQPFVAGSIIEVLEYEGNFLELTLRDGTVVKIIPGESYTVPTLKYELNAEKIQGSTNEYEVTETYSVTSKTPTPLPSEVKDSMEDIQYAMDAFESGEMDSSDLFSVIQSGVDSIMSFINNLISSAPAEE